MKYRLRAVSWYHISTAFWKSRACQDVRPIHQSAFSHGHGTKFVSSLTPKLRRKGRTGRYLLSIWSTELHLLLFIKTERKFANDLSLAAGIRFCSFRVIVEITMMLLSWMLKMSCTARLNIYMWQPIIGNFNLNASDLFVLQLPPIRLTTFSHFFLKTDRTISRNSACAFAVSYSSASNGESAGTTRLWNTSNTQMKCVWKDEHPPKDSANLSGSSWVVSFRHGLLEETNISSMTQPRSLQP